MEAISHAGTVLGVLATDGVVIAAEKKVTGKLLDLSATKVGDYGGNGEKIFLLNTYVAYIPSTLLNVFNSPLQECDRRRSGHHGRCAFARELRTVSGAAAFV